MWSDREADAAACPGAGTPAFPAPTLEDGFPGGRALCPQCWGFVALAGDVLAPHDAFRGAADDVEAGERASWFNTYGWSG
jgi:hypothetical protein